MRQDDLVVYQGEDWTAEWPVMDANGSPLNVTTGYTLKAQVRATTRSGTVLHQWDSGTPQVVLSGTTIALKIPAATSSAFPPGWGGVYDVELTEIASGRVVRLAKGVITLDPEITR